MDKDFLSKIERIHKIILAIKGNKDFFVDLSMKMNVDNNGKGNVLIKLPSENSIKIFILDFRPFLLQGEFAYIPSLCNQISKECKDYDLGISNSAHSFKKEWSDFLNGTNIGGIATKINGEQVKIKDKVDVWLNGKFMHPTDLKDNKHIKLDSIKVPPFGPMDYYFFLEVLQRLANSLNYFDENILKKILLDGEGNKNS